MLSQTLVDASIPADEFEWQSSTLVDTLVPTQEDNEVAELLNVIKYDETLMPTQCENTDENESELYTESEPEIDSDEDSQDTLKLCGYMTPESRCSHMTASHMFPIIFPKDTEYEEYEEEDDDDFRSLSPVLSISSILVKRKLDFINE